MKIKNLFFVYFLVIVLLFTSACGNTQQNSDTPTDTPTDVPQTDITETKAPDEISDTAVVISADKLEASVGETVEVGVSILNGNPLNGIQFVIKYDNTKLKLVSSDENINEQLSEAIGGISSVTLSDNSISLAWINSSAKKIDKNILSAKFEIIGGNVGDIVDIAVTDYVAAFYNDKGDSTAYDDVQAVNGAVTIK